MKETYESQLSKAEENYRESLSAAMLAYKKTLDEKFQEKDRIVRKTLRFLSSLGLDLIPQSLTDEIIARVNRSPELIAIFGMSKDTSIDFAQGKLGYNNTPTSSNPQTLENKRAFAEFIYALLGQPKSFNLDALGTGAVIISDQLAFKTEVSQSGILDM